MAEIYVPPTSEIYEVSKAAAQVSTQEISLDRPSTESGITFALQWPNGINDILIVPNISIIEGELQKRGWQSKVKQFDALLMALFTVSLPEGQVTYPEKAAEDWVAAIGLVNGTINLGLVPDTPITVDTDIPEIKENVGDGVSYGLQWPKDMNTILIVPYISVIENFLRERGWQVGVRNLQALMMATFTLSLPEGEFTFPEKAGEDWTQAVGQVPGVINLGLLAGEFTTLASSLAVVNEDAHYKFAAQYPEGLNANLIEPMASYIQDGLRQLGWLVEYQILDGIRFAVYGMNVPEGHDIYPEKAAQDFAKVVGELHGWINLGSVKGEFTLSTAAAAGTSGDKHFQGTVQWDPEMLQDLIEPMASVINSTLEEKGYKSSYYHGDGNTRITTYVFSYTPADSEVPEKVQIDWEDAVAEAKGGRDVGLVETPVHTQ